MCDKDEQKLSKSLSIGEEIDAKKISPKEERAKNLIQAYSETKETSIIEGNTRQPLKERPWEDMVITPMLGIPPLNCSPPYRPHQKLAYADSPENEEELIFNLEMDY